MRAVIQRVSEASVTVNGNQIANISTGVMILLAIHHNDVVKDAQWLASKCANLRIFSDNNDKMNLSLLDIQGEALVVSQFTLYGNCLKGRRPAFIESAHPQHAQDLYENFIKFLKKELSEEKVFSGRFAAKMNVSLVNNGPITLIIDTPA